MIPFLVYHRIGHRGTETAAHTVTTATFRRHLNLLRSAGSPVLHPRMLTEDGWPAEGIILAFDDATRDHAEAVREALRVDGITAIFYVPTAELDQPGHLTQDEVRRLHEDGHLIASHSHFHRRLNEVPIGFVREQLLTSRAILHDITGEMPRHFAPPGGVFDRNTLDAALEAGFNFFRTMRWGYNRRLDPRNVEVVPMTEALGSSFLQLAMSRRAERVFRTAGWAKDRIRDNLPASYIGLRRRLLGASR